MARSSGSAPKVNVTVTLVIALPRDEWLSLRLADQLGRFIEQAHKAGAEVQLHPSPEEAMRDLAAVRAELESIEGHADVKAELHVQLGRIERLTKFRKLVQLP